MNSVFSNDVDCLCQSPLCLIRVVKKFMNIILFLNITHKNIYIFTLFYFIPHINFNF